VTVLIHNCSLTKVAGPRTTEESGVSESNGPTKWQGISGAFVEDRRLQLLASEEVTRSTVTVLTVDPVADVEPGDYVTYTYRGASLTRLVAEVAPEELSATLVALELALEPL
jgi:hypothetical protein